MNTTRSIRPGPFLALVWSNYTKIHYIPPSRKITTNIWYRCTKIIIRTYILYLFNPQFFTGITTPHPNPTTCISLVLQPSFAVFSIPQKTVGTSETSFAPHLHHRRTPPPLTPQWAKARARNGASSSQARPAPTWLAPVAACPGASYPGAVLPRRLLPSPFCEYDDEGTQL